MIGVSGKLAIFVASASRVEIFLKAREGLNTQRPRSKTRILRRCSRRRRTSSDITRTRCRRLR